MVDRTAVVDGPLVDGAHAVEQAAGRMRDRVVSGAKDKLESSREYVSGNPLASVAIAVGVGALIGYLVGRRTT